MAPLTATTIRYLFAAEWAERDDSNWGMHVPGAKVAGLNTAANLLMVAVWSLREQQLVSVEQVRPVEIERVVTLGGRSFVRLRALDQTAELAGLEGALLRVARESAAQRGLGRVAAAIGTAISGDDPDGLRGRVLNLELSSGSPWWTVASYCVAEAKAAGLVEVKGWMIKKPVISDPAAVDALRRRDAEIVAARTRFREREQDLDDAVIADCAAAIDWAHQG